MSSLTISLKTVIVRKETELQISESIQSSNAFCFFFRIFVSYNMAMLTQNEFFLQRLVQHCYIISLPVFWHDANATLTKE